MLRTAGSNLLKNSTSGAATSSFADIRTSLPPCSKRLGSRRAACNTRPASSVRLPVAEANYRRSSSWTDRALSAMRFLWALLSRSNPTAERLGCELTSEGRIAIDARHRTSVDGCYAAGDAVTAMHQVIVAAASGVSAAVRINDDLTQDDVAAIIG